MVQVGMKRDMKPTSITITNETDQTSTVVKGHILPNHFVHNGNIIIFDSKNDNFKIVWWNKVYFIIKDGCIKFYCDNIGAILEQCMTFYKGTATFNLDSKRFSGCNVIFFTFGKPKKLLIDRYGNYSENGDMFGDFTYEFTY
uniref:DUF943 family protein n=1 Tax=Rhabditophanes sp. KR3021 TaxID=114890 RepID=A0AC35TTE8_9BILA